MGREDRMGLLLLILTGIAASSSLAKPLCDEGSSYCEDPPNYPAHTIQRLLHKYSAQLRFLLPFSGYTAAVTAGPPAAPLPPPPTAAVGVDGAAPIDHGDNAVDDGTSGDTWENSVELV